MPSYCEKFKWIDQVPDRWYVPHSEDDDGVDNDLGVVIRSEVGMTSVDKSDERTTYNTGSCRAGKAVVSAGFASNGRQPNGAPGTQLARKVMCGPWGRPPVDSLPRLACRCRRRIKQYRYARMRRRWKSAGKRGEGRIMSGLAHKRSNCRTFLVRQWWKVCVNGAATLVLSYNWMRRTR